MQCLKISLPHTSGLGVSQVNVTMESYNEFQQEGREGEGETV